MTILLTIVAIFLVEKIILFSTGSILHLLKKLGEARVVYFVPMYGTFVFMKDVIDYQRRIYDERSNK